MSVERVERKDGSVVWRVRRRQGGRNRSKVPGRKLDAEAFDAELVRRKRTGDLAQLDAGKELLADFGEEWWRQAPAVGRARRKDSVCDSAAGRRDPRRPRPLPLPDDRPDRRAVVGGLRPAGGAPADDTPVRGRLRRALSPADAPRFVPVDLLSGARRVPRG